MARIEIRCPACKKLGNLEIGEENIKNTLRGLLAVNVASNTICSHSFITYIDKNFIVRDYFVPDFQMEIPDLLPKDQLQDTSVPEKEIVNIDLIKLNIPATLLSNVLKSIFSKKKIVILSHQPFLNNYILNFFKYITKDSFNIDILVISEEEYKKNKALLKDSMVFDGKEILKNLNNIIEPKKMKVEKEIVNRFLSEYELGYSYILLKSEIHKAFLLSKSIIDFANDYSNMIELSSKKVNDDSIFTSIMDGVINREKFISNVVSDHLEKNHNVKIQKYYLNFLFEIVKNYFEVDLKELINIIS